MLNLIEAEHGSSLAVAISEEFICERIRGKNDRQRIPLNHRLGTSQPKLVDAISLMEANLEEPMSLDELSRHVGLSRRQLERLFQKHVRCVPTRYYLELRLARARQLLLQTTRPIVDIAFACGFVLRAPLQQVLPRSLRRSSSRGTAAWAASDRCHGPGAVADRRDRLTDDDCA